MSSSGAVPRRPEAWQDTVIVWQTETGELELQYIADTPMPGEPIKQFIDRIAMDNLSAWQCSGTPPRKRLPDMSRGQVPRDRRHRSRWRWRWTSEEEGEVYVTQPSE